MRRKDRLRMDIRLSARLDMVASFVRPGSRVADVGCDHGYVPIALVQRGIAERALAMDVREEPLKRAAEHIRLSGFEGRIETRLSDGVTALEAGEADTVIAAGMGGSLIVHILEGGRGLWESVGHWILSPQSEPEKVRYFLQMNGFSIEREAMVEEDGKFYVAIDAARGGMEPLSAAQALYGPCLIRAHHPVLTEYLKREEAVLTQILSGLAGRTGGSAAARRKELESRLDCVRQARQDGGIR